MRKLKRLSFVLAAVCALSTACGQSTTTNTTAAIAETTAETKNTEETNAAVASGGETAAEQTLDTTGLVPVLSLIHILTTWRWQPDREVSPWKSSKNSRQSITFSFR